MGTVIVPPFFVYNTIFSFKAILRNDMQIQPAYPTINELQAYPAGKPLEEFKREYGIEDVIKLASNENPLGCSPHVTLAIVQELAQLARYPDSNAHNIKQALSEFHDLPIEYFTIGNGSEELINLIARCFVGSNDAVVFGQYSFIAYPLVTAAQGATKIEVPAKNYGIDLDAMLDAIKTNEEKVKVVFIANPNNPTGTILTKEQIHNFLQKVPPSVLVVLDEAYVDYDTSADAQEFVQQFDNVIVLRTFSKAYGLAGVRIGYAIANPEINDIFNRVRQPFNVNCIAQAAAVAAINDRDFVNTVKTTTADKRKWFYKQFDALGLNYVKSHTNFILVQIDNASDINQKLLEQGIIIRPMDEYGLDNWIRVSMGTEVENIRFIDSLKDLLSA